MLTGGAWIGIGICSLSAQPVHHGVDLTVTRAEAVGFSSVRLEYNRSTGVIVVTSTKSGSNKIHGSAYEFFRNSYLDSKNYFDLKTIPIPPDKLNDFGGSVGFPVLHDKVFGFADYEGFIERLASTVVTTVPTLAERQDNFQGNAHIYDPTTTVQNGANYTRTEFTNDIIPASKFDPVAAAIVAPYPTPQTSALVNNYTSYPVKAMLTTAATLAWMRSLPVSKIYSCAPPSTTRSSPCRTPTTMPSAATRVPFLAATRPWRTMVWPDTP